MEKSHCRPNFYFLDDLPSTVIMMVLNLIITLNNLEYYEKLFRSLGLWEPFLNLITERYTFNIPDESLLFLRIFNHDGRHIINKYIYI